MNEEVVHDIYEIVYNAVQRMFMYVHTHLDNTDSALEMRKVKLAMCDIGLAFDLLIDISCIVNNAVSRIKHYVAKDNEELMSLINLYNRVENMVQRLNKIINVDMDDLIKIDDKYNFESIEHENDIEDEKEKNEYRRFIEKLNSVRNQIRELMNEIN